MMTLTQSAHDIARKMERYARSYNAGAFAMPIEKDVEKLLEENALIQNRGVLAVKKTLDRPSTRKDFTGQKFQLSGTVITHLAADPGAVLPDLSDVNYVRAYLEDKNVENQLFEQGFYKQYVQVSAASELIGFYGRGWLPGYAPIDVATLLKIELDVPPVQREAIAQEALTVNEWFDDFPYYSDGSWNAVSLRGFDPSDPTMRVKPSEMGKSWWAEHPDANEKWGRCDWTVLTERTPATRELVESLGFAGLERVSFLRMEGREKDGILRRHTDVTDKTMGTADGQVFRFFIPVVTYRGAKTAAWNLEGTGFECHLDPWALWYLDARKPHAVYNRSGKDRIHLSFDAVVDEAARQMLLDKGKEYAA